MSEDITLTCCSGCDREAALKAEVERLRAMVDETDGMAIAVAKECQNMRAALRRVTNAHDLDEAIIIAATSLDENLRALANK